MSEVVKVGGSRRSYTNTSPGPVLYPLGTMKVEVPAGGTLVYYTYDAGPDAFMRSRDRRKLMEKVAPVLAVGVILILGVLVVAYMTLKASQGG